MPELQLAVNITGWRLFVHRREDKAFLPLARKVWARDAYTCQYCGFQAKEFQEVVNADGQYRNNTPGNLLTCCCFCSQCLFLQAVGWDEKSGGQIIYLPEISQADLNSFCHVLFCAMGNSTDYYDSAQSIYRSFKFRSQVIEDKFGVGTSNPSVFGQMLVDYQALRSPKDMQSILQPLRLLPSPVRFKAQLETWAMSASEQLETQADLSTEG